MIDHKGLCRDNVLTLPRPVLRERVGVRALSYMPRVVFGLVAHSRSVILRYSEGSTRCGAAARSFGVHQDEGIVEGFSAAGSLAGGHPRNWDKTAGEGAGGTKKLCRVGVLARRLCFIRARRDTAQSMVGEYANPTSPSAHLATSLLCACVLLGLTSAARAAATDLTFRLVRSDAPDQLVSTAITKIDVEAEQARKLAEAQDAANNPGLVKDNGVVPQAQFDHYSNYMRGIVIDATHNFYREYKGSFLGRSDVIHLALEDGEHVINPGAHHFTLAGGKVSSADPTLKISGTTIDIQIFPVTVMAVDGSAIRKMPAEVRRLPVSARLFWNAEELLPKEENLALTATFKRLTLYMLANSQGAGYRVSPSDRQFYVTPDGIVVLDDAGKPAPDSASLVEGKFTLVLPQRAVPITIVGGDVNVLIAGPAGRLLIPPSQKAVKDAVFYAFPASGGALITVGHRASNQPMLLPGDFNRFPRRKIMIDSTSAASKEPRVMSASMAAYTPSRGRCSRRACSCSMRWTRRRSRRRRCRRISGKRRCLGKMDG